MKKIKMWKRIMALLMAVLLIGQSQAMSVVTLASEYRQVPQITEEESTAASESEAISEEETASVTETNQTEEASLESNTELSATEGIETETEKNVRAAADITARQEEINFKIRKASVQDVNGDKKISEISGENGKLDFSALSPETMGTVELEISFDFLKTAEAWDIRDKDTFVLNLSGTALQFADSNGAKSIYNRKSADSKEVTEQILGSYEVRNQQLFVTLGELFASKENLPQIIGRICVNAVVDKSALKEGTSTENMLALTKQNQVTVVFPALTKKAEEKNTEATEKIETTEKVTEKVTEAATEKETETKQVPSAKPRSLGENAQRAVTPGALTEVSAMIEWLDFKADTRPDLIADELLQISFTIDGNTSVLSAGTMGQLGLTQLPALSSTTDNLGVGFQKIFCQLPATVNVPNGSGTQNKTVTYKISQTFGAYGNESEYMQATGYMAPRQKADGTWINGIQSEFVMELDLKQGDGTRTLEEFYDSIFLYHGQESVGSLADIKNHIEVDPSNPTQLHIKGIPAFSDDKVEYIYAAKIQGDKVVLNGMEDQDFFEPIYLNENSANFGSNKVETHDGGTLRLILTGTTEYTMTKKWLDEFTGVDGVEPEKEAQRPVAELHLWRYTIRNNGDYTTAAQVKDENGSNIVCNIDKIQDIQSIAMGQDLAKYDPEGFRYVYLARENLSGPGYEQVYGDITGTPGNVVIKDTIPYAGNRKSSDQSIYHTGTICNRRTDSESLTQKKTWKASAHQNQLSEVVVTLSLEKREKGSSQDWQETGIAKELTGFIAEQMTKEAAANVPSYDEYGKPLEYRWTESKIEETVNGKKVEVPFTENNGVITFKLSHNETDEGEEWYESTVEGDTIVNRLVGVVDYTADKLWAQLDAQGNVMKDAQGKEIYGKTPPTPGAQITLKLLRDMEDYKDENGNIIYYPMNGKTDDDAYEYTPYSLRIDGLPKYNEEGRKYSYVAEEGSGYGGWHSSYKYDVTDQDGNQWDCQISNSPVGPGNIIKVRKIWLDDGDEQHRGDIQVAVYRKAQAGETEDYYVGTTTLNAKGNWWSYVNVNEYEEDADGNKVPKPIKDPKYYMREVKMGNFDVVDANGNVLTPTNAKAPTADTIDTVESNEHHYEVTYSERNGELVVSNRRIGIVDVTVTKKWVDKGAQESERPKAKLRLEIVEAGYENAIDRANNTIDLNIGRSLQIQDKDGKPAASVQTVQTTGDTSTYEFFNLPKYDDKGAIVHYQVTELPDDAQEFKDKFYIVSTKDEAYTVGKHHAADSQSLTIENRRSGTKDVYFYKQWKDIYVYESGKRPDIYLTLWCKDSIKNNGQIYAIEEYKNRVWKAGDNDPNHTLYFWKCDFGSLPKYDNNGQEIIYYATESMPVNGAEFDYTDVTLDDAHRVYLDDKGDITQDENQAAGEILEEYGTFTNAIYNQVHITGKKIWKNIPEGFPTSELPPLKIWVDREGKNKTEKEIAWTTTLTGSGKELAFGLDYFGGNTMDDTGIHPDDPKAEVLPKYDEDGNLYIYTVHEEVLKTDWDADDPSPEDTTYEKLPGEVNDFIITNAYNLSGKNGGKLTVEKVWDMTAARDMTQIYPVVNFTLERRYKMNHPIGSQTESAWEKVTVKKVDCNDPSIWQGTTAVYEFDNLVKFAPNGNEYEYRITEEQIDGYTTKKQTIEITNPISDDVTVDATFENVYNNPKEQIRVSGTKKWDDLSNKFGIRPDSIELTLYRYANAQPKENNGIGSKEKPDTKFSKTIRIDSSSASASNGDIWEYEFQDLERYAPNGMPWIYVVREEESKNAGSNLQYYDLANQTNQTLTVEQASVNSKNGDVTMKVLTNTSSKSLKITKEWTNSNNSHNLRPSEIKVKLQVKYGNEVWVDAKDPAEGLAAKLTDTSATLPCKIDNLTMTAAAKWTASYTGLPAYIKDGGAIEPCYYRVIETSITAGMNTLQEIPVTAADESAENVVYDKCWIYQPSATTTLIKGSKKQDETKLTNDLLAGETKTLTVQKIWSGDSNNAFLSRPLTKDQTQWEITVKIQEKAEGALDFVDVKDVQGNVLTKTFKGDANLKSEEPAVFIITGLPLEDTQGKTMTYRAVEVEPGTTKEAVTLGSYTVTRKDTPDTSEITNRLETVSLKVTKVWAGEPTAFGASKRPAVLKLNLWADSKDITTQYKQELTWDKQEGTWAYTYEHLPKKDQTGNVVSYSVTESIQDGYQTPVVSGVTSSAVPDMYETTITNTMTKMSLVKTNDAGKELTGYKFEIYTDNSGKKGTLAAEYTDTTGSLYGLKAGKYILSETTAPAGYQLGADISFELTADSTLKFTNPAPAHGTIDPKDQSRMKITDVKTSFQVEKAARNEVAATPGKTTLAGAELAICLETGEIAKTVDGEELKWTSQQQGKTIAGLAAGTYVLKELKTPEGFVTARDITFTLDEKNQVVLKQPSQDAEITTDSVTKTDKLTLIDRMVYGTVKLIKTGKDGQALPGVHFSLYREKRGSESDDVLITDSIVTDNQGVWQDDTVKLVYGSYYFVETATVDDHKIDGAHQTFEIRPDTTNNPDTGITTSTQPAQVVEVPIVNKGFKTYVSLQKMDNLDISQGIAGVEFTLYQKGTDGKLLELRKLTTGTDGVLMDGGNQKIELTKKGTYVLKETKAVYGYLFQETKAYTATFTVENTDDFQEQILTLGNQVKEDMVKKYSLTIENQMTQKEEAVVTNEHIKGNISLTKVSETGVALKGVTFTLWQKADKNNGLAADRQVVQGSTDKWSTDEKGEILIQNLDAGTYYFKEESTLDDKLLDENAFPEKGIEINQSNHQKTLSVKMENKDFEASVKLIKKLEGTQQGIPNVQFTLYKKVGADYERYQDGITSDKNGVVTAQIHHKGEYRLVETKAAEGYVLGEASTVTKEFSIKNTADFQNVEIDLGELTNKKTKLMIQKNGISLEETKGLSGAELTLYTKDRKIAETIDGEKLQWTTDTGGKVIEGLPAGTYTLKETKTPAGYVTANDIILTLGDDNAASITQTGNAGSVSKEADISTITVADDLVYGNVILRKTGKEGQPLGGVTFDLYRQTEGANAILVKSQIVTDDKGEWNDASWKLPYGKYYFVETETQDDHKLDTKEWTFEIVPDSSTNTYTQITTTTQPQNAVEVDIANIGFRTFVSLKKTDHLDETKGLEGVEFVLYKKETNGRLQPLKTMNTDSDGVLRDGKALKVELTRKGTYVLKETGTIYGYSFDKDNAYTAEFTVDNTDAFQEQELILGNQVEEKTAKKYQLTIQNQMEQTSANVTNEHIKGTLRLTKAAAEDQNEPLGGVKFELWEKANDKKGLLNDQKVVQNGQEIWVTNEAGQILIENLDEGNYYFKEVETLDNRLLPSETFPAEGALAIDAKTNGSIVDISVENKEFATYLELTKTDNLNEDMGIPGVEFTLYERTNSGELKEVKVLTTKEDGKLTGTINKKGTYVLKETKPAYGYVFHPEKAYTAEFTVSNTEAFQEETLVLGNTIRQEDAAKYNAAIENQMTEESVKDSANVTNERIKASVQLKKVGEAKEDGTIEALAGVEFELWKKADEANGISQDVKMSVDHKEVFITDQNGQIIIENLDAGSYYFKEIKTLDDKLLASQTFPENGEILVNQDVHGTVISLTMENKNFETKALFTKTDAEDGTPIAGARFTLYRKDGDTYKPYGSTIISDEKGKVEATIHHRGDYRFTETKAAPGYTLGEASTLVREFSVENTDAYQGKTFVQKDIKNQKTYVEILKRGALDESDKGLPGAGFTLMGKLANGKESISWVSGEAAEPLKGLLIAGESYVLKEIKAPAGYVSAELPQITIKMDENGKLSECNGAIMDGSRITVENTPIELQISKNGADTGKPLSGCVFGVTGIFAPARYDVTEQADAQGADEVSTIIVDDEHPHALKGRLIVNNTYTLKEINPPDGYEVGGEVKFTVHADGSITMEQSDEYTFVKDEKTGKMQIVMKDDPIEVKLQKTDESGNPLKGAEFTIEGIFANGDGIKEERSFTSDSEGIINLDKVLKEGGGEYLLTETKAPSGYEKLSEPVKFKVLSGGVVELDKSSIAESVAAMLSLTEKEDVYTLSIKNRKTEKTESEKTTPEKTTPKKTTPETNKPTAAKVTASKTGDETPILPLAFGMIIAGGVLLIGRKKVKQK